MDLYGGANLSTLSRNFTTAETTRHLEEFERSSLGYGTESSKMVKTFGLALSVGDMPLIPNRPYKLPTQGEVDQLPTLMTTAYHTTGVLLSTAESTGTTLGGSIQMENYVKVSLDTIQHTGRHKECAPALRLSWSCEISPRSTPEIAHGWHIRRVHCRNVL